MRRCGDAAPRRAAPARAPSLPSLSRLCLETLSLSASQSGALSLSLPLSPPLPPSPPRSLSFLRLVLSERDVTDVTARDVIKQDETHRSKAVTDDVTETVIDDVTGRAEADRDVANTALDYAADGIADAAHFFNAGNHRRGGRGMRVIEAAADLHDRVAEARRPPLPHASR